jgi:hypothetical protein
VVERTLGWLTRCRRLCRDYERASFLKGLDRRVDAEIVHYPRPRLVVSQVRIALGRMILPADSDTVFNTVLARHREAMTVHASASMTPMEQY